MTPMETSRLRTRYMANVFEAFAFDPNNYTQTQRGTYVSKGGRAMSQAQFQAAVKRYQAQKPRDPNAPKGDRPGTGKTARISDEQLKAKAGEQTYGRYERKEIGRPRLLQIVRKMKTPAKPEVQEAAAQAIPGVAKLAGLTGETGQAVQAKLAEAVQASGKGGIGGAVQGLVSWLRSLPRAAAKLAWRGLQAVGRKAMANLGDFAKVFTGPAGMAAGGFAGMKLGTPFGPLGMMLGTAGGAAAGALIGTGDFGGLRRLATLRGGVGAAAGLVADPLKRAGRFGLNAAKLALLPPRAHELPLDQAPNPDPKWKRWAKAGLWHTGILATWAAAIAAPFLIGPTAVGGALAAKALLSGGTFLAGAIRHPYNPLRRLGLTSAIADGRIKLSEGRWESFAGWDDWTQQGDRMVSPSGKRKLKLETFKRLSAKKAGQPKAAPAEAPSAPTPEQVALRNQYQRGTISARTLAAKTKAATGAPPAPLAPPAPPVPLRPQPPVTLGGKPVRVVVDKRWSDPPSDKPLTPAEKQAALDEHTKTATLLSISMRSSAGLPPDPELMKRAGDLGLKVAHLLEPDPAARGVIGRVKDRTVRAAAYVAAKLGAGAKWLDKSLMPRAIGGLAAAGTGLATVPLGVGAGLAAMIGTFAVKGFNPILNMLGAFDWMDKIPDAGLAAMNWGVRTPGRVYRRVRDGVAAMAEPPGPKLAELKAALDAVRKVSDLPPFTDDQLRQILTAVQQAAGGAAPRTFPGK